MTEASTTSTRDRPVRVETAAELDRLVADEDLVLVEFFTEGCSMCASMEPVLGNVARTSDAAVATVNPRDDPGLIERFDVRSVPLLVLFEGGEVVARLAEGFQGGDAVDEFVESHRA